MRTTIGEGKADTNGGFNMRTWYRIAAATVCLLALAGGCAQGEVGEQVDLVASLNGTALSATSPNNPVRIADADTAELMLNMTNVSSEPVTVRYVRFEGEVIDMIFLTYDTAISVPLAAGESRTLPPVLLDFFDLGGQADGYLRGNVQLYDEERNALGSQQVFLDARGDGLSTLELFNLLLLGGTVLGAAWNLLRLSQRRLPANRLVRALRFLAVGAGAGMTLAVAFSTLRIWPLPTLTWLLFTIVGAIIGYAIGLWLPGSEGDDIDLLDEEDLLEELVLEQEDMLVKATPTGAIAGARSPVATKAPAKPASSKNPAKETIADNAPKETIVGKAAKSTAAGDASKETVLDLSDSKATVTGKASVEGNAAKKTIAKAPGSGARETIAETKSVDEPTPKAKETLPDQ